VVESRPGDGTKIVINLPAQLKNNSPDEKDSEKQVRQNDFTMDRKSILVVEDEAIIRELYGEILSMQGYHFEMAETGEEGVQMWESGQYNLVICDLGLPGLLSGWDVIEKIREKDREMPVLVVTGWGNSTERTKIEKYQVNRVLSKPVAVNKLVSEIAAMIN
jgi:CheY-like chemotaxis protein